LGTRYSFASHRVRDEEGDWRDLVGRRNVQVGPREQRGNAGRHGQSPEIRRIIDLAADQAARGAPLAAASVKPRFVPAHPRFEFCNG
jgi:hypothetical protein